MDTTRTRTPLSPIDYTFLGESAYPIEFLFRFDGRLDPDALKRGLERVLPDFAPVGSVLKKTGAETVAFETSPDACPFTVVESDRDPVLEGSQAYDLLDPVDTLPGEPLARFELTLGPNASVLGASLSHAIVDGYSYFYFMASWAAACRGDAYRAPVHDRALLSPEDVPEMDLSEEAIREGTGWSFGEERAAPPRESLRWQRLEFPLQTLKAEVAEASEKTGVRLSVNDVLVVKLWKRFAGEWPQSGERRFLSLPIDFRRVHPGIDLRYFGNAVRGVTLARTPEELDAIAIHEAAASVHRAVASVKGDEAIHSLRQLEALRRERGSEALRRLHVSHPGAGLLVTNLSRVPAARIDFGTGGPADYRILTPAPRTAAVLPGGDSLFVDVCPPL
jgi:hypothetical protein